MHAKRRIKLLKMKSIKYGAAVDSLLHAAKTPMRMSKWLAAEQWAGVIRNMLNIKSKQEALDEKGLNCVLGRDERLKRVMHVHSDLDCVIEF